MSNSDQLSNRLLFLRQVHCELVEQLAQLKKLREKLRTAERKAGAQMRIIHASKYAAAAGQTATHPSHSTGSSGKLTKGHFRGIPDSR